MSQLNVRISHKYDTLENWKLSTIVLNKGEIAVCEIPQDATGSGLTPPAIGVKIGDGSKTFSQLSWIQTTAGDVYAWAKKEHLDYADLSDAFKEELKDLVNDEIQDTNTTYQFAYANDTLTISHKEKGQEEFTKLIDLPITLSTKMDKDTDAVEGNLAQFDANGNAVDAGEKIGDFLKKTDAAGTYATQEALGGLEETVTDHGTRLGTAEGKLTTLIGEDADKSIRTIANEELAAQLIGESAKESLDTLEEIAAWIQAHPDDAAAMNQAIKALEGRAKALEEKDVEHGNSIKDNADAIAKLEETDHTHTNKDVLDGIDADKVGEWDKAVQSVSGVETTKTGTDVAVTAVPVTLLKNTEGDTLVFNCGTASTVI